MPRRRFAIASVDAGLRNPITGIAGCCARAASGHAAAAPPSSVMNIAPPHSITSSARGEQRRQARRGRALWQSSYWSRPTNLVACSTGMSAGLVPLQNLIHENGGAAIHFEILHAVADQAARLRRIR